MLNKKFLKSLLKLIIKFILIKILSLVISNHFNISPILIEVILESLYYFLFSLIKNSLAYLIKIVYI
jgi:hypothetical protein